MRFDETMEIHGHLMDSGVLARILEDVVDYGGDYRIDRIDLGRTHDDESRARIAVGAETGEQLQCIPMRIQIHGANKVHPGETVLWPAEGDGVFEDFYLTTNLTSAPAI